VTSLIAWQWRWCYALSSIKTQHKIISAKHEKVTLLVRTNSQIKTRFNTKTAIALHTWRTTQKSQVHNCTSHSTITIKHNRALKIFKCFPAYLGLSKIGWVPIWGKTYRVTIWFSHNSKHETLQRFLRRPKVVFSASLRAGLTKITIFFQIKKIGFKKI